MISLLLNVLVKLCSVIALLQVTAVLTFDYYVAVRTDRIIETCPGEEQYDMFNSMNFTNLEYEFITEDTFTIAGSFTPIWDADPSDKIMVRGALYKWSRGDWIPTTLAMHIDDFCARLYKPKEYWYEGFFQYVYKEDRVCVNHKGALFRLHPANITLIFDNVPTPNLSGRYKIKTYIYLIDTNGKRKKDYICYELHIELLLE